MRGHDRHNQRPPHGYNPYPPGAQWLDAASTSGANPAAMGINPYAPYPQYAQNPVNLFLPHLHQAALQNQANLAAYYHHQQQQQQQQQYQYQPPVHSSPAYTPNPTTNSKRRPSNPPAAAAVPSPPKPPPRNQHAVLEKAQAAAWKARDELTRARQGVTGCKVAQAALVALKADSWDSLGVRLHDVPLLRDLFLIEGKVNTFIHCYVAARKIVSAYDLEVEICKNQGVGQFEELGLGPFLHHPLVSHYFLVPADSPKVPKLTSEEIIKCLRKFMDSCKEKVTVENFLNYLAEQKSVSGKEKLGVRIKSLGLHISFLRQARSDEVAAVRLLGKTNVSGDNSCDKELPKFHLDKEELNERFDAITSRIKQLPGINKHIHFDSTDDEIDGDTSSEDESAKKDGCSILDGKDVDKRVNSCPYPSKTEEMERLGLKSEMSKMPATESTKVKERGKKGDSREKRKYEENGTPSSLGKPPKKRQKVQMEKEEMSPSCFLSTGKLEKFITTWKEACREHPIPQVLEMLANYYGENAQEKKKMIKFFSQYPGIGFLNVAVRSMGCGLLDSLYDLIHVVSENKSSSSPICNTTTEVMEIEPPSKKSADCIAKGANNANVEPGPNVTTDDVIRKITEHFESISGASGARTLQVGKFVLLRTLHDCETWVTRQFSTKQFSCLGHGTFLEFLERHSRHLPPKLSSFLKGRDSGSLSVEVSVLQRQIEVLLWQAKGNWLKNAEFSEDGFCMLLKRQFPAICFDVEQNKSGEGLDGSIEGQGKNIHTDNITFSMSLLEKRWSGISPGDHDTVGGPRNGAVDQSYYSETISSREAINCLLRAPMLSDLLRWSHWDLLFAPSLGSFILWLLNTGPIQQIACIVTTDGRFVRVDPSATVDQFLEAIIQRSPFQVAVKLLSLLHIYNGSANTPISLLKCYAQRAIGIIMNNNNDLMSINSEGKTLTPGESYDLSAEQRDYSTRYTGCVQESSELSSARNITSDILTNIDSTVQFIAKFVLDCLGHLPSEFWNLAADILLAGLRTVTKNGYSAILREATETWQLCMLHDIGLSLGIAEWVEDYRGFCVSEEVRAKTELHSSSRHTSAASEGATLQSDNMPISHDVDVINDNSKPFSCKNDQVVAVNNKTESTLNPLGANADTAELHTNKLPMMGETNLEEAALVIETIRREEFGLDQALSSTENSLLKKQHARLGRALHCLSQELYSQDSHLLLELVQNADDNTYLEDVEPTLAFILQENGVVVLNNERGFSAENIRALCDIGNSTKKGSNRGYIGNKGIGFKSVFRVTDNPEIHSNGFHVKFDITEGQIGFVMPTAVPPYSVSSLSRMLSVEDDKNDCSFWNTCILLPFRSKFREGTGMCSIASMFADLHPSLLLFLHRLNCIKFKNVLNDTLLVMRRKALGDGIVRISHGNEIMSWLVASKKLEGTLVRHDVCTTEIAVAFTLQETGKGEYEPYLKQQPVFAFLPLRNYGLKFILQGDFVLPSSREEVDADNAWNQWLLSEFPSLFVSAQESFCALPCFQRCPGKAVTAFMSFVPLAGEVHGFFCKLPHLILSKLRLTRCMVLEGSSLQWAYPCNTLRGWDEQTRLLFSDGLLHEHLSLGYLSKDIIISDTLSRALGIHDYGLNVFIDIISSICRTDGCIESLGVEWLCAWFVTLHSILSHSSRNIPSTSGLEGDLLCALRKIPCIPLSDGSFSSVADGPIWLPHDILSSTPDCKSNMQDFPVLYSNLRIVSPYLLDLPCKNKYLKEEMRANDLMDILLKVGVRKLSGHEIIKNHILGSFSNGTDANMSNKMMIEYVRFIMLHLQSSCTSCRFEKEDIVSELRRRPILLTNHGYKYPADEPIHFSREYGSSVDISKLLHNVEFRWIELDSCYLMNHGSDSLPSMLKKWRLFFEEMGVTEFVQVVRVEKNIPQVDSLIVGSQLQRDTSGTPSTVYDWESQELASILSTFSSKKCRENCVYLLEVLDNLWGDYYGAKAWSVTNVAHGGETKTVESSFMNCIRSFKWIASSMDDDLHYATDLFCDSENVRSLLGSVAPYAVPQISSRSLRKDIGFKTNVSHRDALMILNLWVASQVPFSASMDQMCKFYTFVSEGAAQEKIDIKQEFVSCSSIFTPLLRVRSGEVIPGKFLSPKDLYWHDPTGCSEMTEDFVSIKKSMFSRRMLSATYPNLCEFFTETCGVQKVPATSDYVGILLRLSNAALPSQVANHVFRVFVRWADDLQSASDKMNDIIYLKESLQKLETTILPTLVDKWVSLHPSFGLICWVDDDDLKQHFKNSSHVDFIQFGELSYEDKQMLHGRVAALMKSLGIPALSKVVHREAIFDGTAGNKEKATLICGLLPYMQRYIYAMHRDTYMNFQQNEMGKLSNLQVIVVEELFHKYVLKGRESSSKRKFKCHCLLQGNNLYATKEADSHSVLLELSRLFFDGSSDLHFANFLLMVKTMVESGTTAEQIESFIVNNQSVPELPEHEAVWSFSPLIIADHIIDSETVERVAANETNIPKHQITEGTVSSPKPQKAEGSVSSWPPTDWNTAPSFGTSRRSQYRPPQETKVNHPGHGEDTWPPVELEGDWVIEEGMGIQNTLLTESTVATLDEPQMMMSVNSAGAPEYLDLETGDLRSEIVDAEVIDFSDKMSKVSEERERLHTGAPDLSQSKRTGKLGEYIVHRHFVEQLGASNVVWVNQESESGLPYDLVITRGDNSKEYVEVKATIASSKSWFYITAREWQFALEQGDSFSIARVVLVRGKKASIIMLKNPHKLCQKKECYLALFMAG